MSQEQLPIDERREPLLDEQSLAAPEPEADRPLGPDAVAPPEPAVCGVDADDPWGTERAPGDLDAGAPWMRDRRKLALIAAGLVASVLVLTALVALFQSSEPDIEPVASAPTTTAALDKALSADIKSIHARLAEQRQAREALTGEVAALRAQVAQIQQAPGSTAKLSTAKLEERLAALQSRLAEISDLGLFLGVLEARLDEQASRIAFLDDLLSAKRQAGDAQAQSTPPTPQVELPFHLAAIEDWDGRPYASLLHDGRQVLVQPGDQCAGWTVQSIDQARRTVRFIRDGVTAVRRVPK